MERHATHANLNRCPRVCPTTQARGREQAGRLRASGHDSRAHRHNLGRMGACTRPLLASDQVCQNSRNAFNGCVLDVDLTGHIIMRSGMGCPGQWKRRSKGTQPRTACHCMGHVSSGGHYAHPTDLTCATHGTATPQYISFCPRPRTAGAPPGKQTVPGIVEERNGNSGRVRNAQR